MRVLITGGAGFIGSNLARRCLDEGWTVDVVDDLSNGHREFLPDELKHIDPSFRGLAEKQHAFFMNDFAIGTPLRRIENGLYNVVFHLAAVPRVSYSVEHPIETNDVNVSRTLRLMDACRGNVGRFVFASSSSVYGGAGNVRPTPESCKKDPRSPYALQKSIIEDYLMLYRDLYELDSVSLRFFNVFGPNQLGDSPYATAVSAWLSAIKKGMPMRSDGDGTQSRDMCYVDNVTDACVKAAQAIWPYDMEPRRYNVACGDTVTNNEILAYMLKRYPQATKVDAPWRPGDVMHTQADVSSARERLGYVPLVRFWDGLEKTVDWYEANWEMISKMRLNT